MTLWEKYGQGQFSFRERGAAKVAPRFCTSALLGVGIPVQERLWIFLPPRPGRLFCAVLDNSGANLYNLIWLSL